MWGGAISIVDYRVVRASEATDESISPYQGLRAFDQSTARFFFGRDEVVKALIEKLGSSSFVILVGASGSGKSSVVRAGLMPKLEQNGWKVLEPIQPGVDAIANIKSSLEKFFRHKDQLSTYSRIHQQIDVGNLRLVLEALPGSEKVLLVIDQFEELFTLCSNEEERQKFIDLLTDVARLAGRFVIVLTMRVDFEADCLNYPTFAKFLDAQRISIPALLGQELERAITEPARFLGYQLEEGLLEAILRDVAQERNCLPLLQFALSKLWELRNQETKKLQVSQYKQLGQGENKIIEALNDHADVIYKSMTPVEQEWGKRICLLLIRTGSESRDTRQRQLKTRVLEVAINETEREIVESVLEKLVHGRLLVTDEGWVDLGHEALMSGWEKLATWREGDRELRRLRDRLADTRQEWVERDDDDFLMSKGLLSQISKRLEELKPYLSQAEQEFYQRSLAQEQENTSYETEISQLKQQFQNVQARLLERMEDSENTQLSATRDEVSNALTSLETFEQRMHSARLVSVWLNNLHSTLVESLARQILDRNPEFPNNHNSLSLVEKFLLLSQDISYYINWLKDSLTRGEPVDNRLNVDMTLPKKFYGEAFKFFRQELHPVELTEEANTELKLYLDYLVRYLSYEND